MQCKSRNHTDIDKNHGIFLIWSHSTRERTVSIGDVAAFAIPNADLAICSEPSVTLNTEYGFFWISSLLSLALCLVFEKSVLNYNPLANFHWKQVFTFNLSLPKTFQIDKKVDLKLLSQSRTKLVDSHFLISKLTTVI